MTELPDRNTAEELVQSWVWGCRSQHQKHNPQKQDGTKTKTAL